MSSPHQQDHFGAGPGFGDGGPRFAFPTITPVVKRLVIANAAVYLLTLLLTLVGVGHGVLLDALGLSRGVWATLAPFLPIWQLGTYSFMHDITPGHVLMNMLGLYFFGTMVESTIGSARFIVHYLIAVMLGGLAFLLKEVATDGNAYLVGASGGMLAMIVAAAVFEPNRMVIFLLFPVPLKWLAGGLVAYDLIYGALSWRASVDGMAQTGGTAYIVHLVGAAYGFLAVRQRWIWFDPVQRFKVRRAIADEEKRHTEAQRMDALLEKIHKEGINSLDRGERDFLKRVSRR